MTSMLKTQRAKKTLEDRFACTDKIVRSENKQDLDSMVPIVEK